MGPAQGDCAVSQGCSHSRSPSPLGKGCDRGPKTLCGATPGLGIAGPMGARTTQRGKKEKNMGGAQFKHRFLSILSPPAIPAHSLEALMAIVMTQL